LQCSQAHKADCAQKQLASESTHDDFRNKEKVENQAQGLPQVSFESLITDEEVQLLFQRYPKLQIQLRHLYQSTLEPNPINQPSDTRRRGSSYRGRWRRNIHDRDDIRPWTPDKGFARGLESLRMQQQSDSLDADGLKELSTLILKRFPVDAQQSTFAAEEVSMVS